MKYIFTVEWADDFVEFCNANDMPLGEFTVAFVKELSRDKLVLALGGDRYCQWIAPDLSEVEARPIYEKIANGLADKLQLNRNNGKVLTVRYYPYGSTSKNAKSPEPAAVDDAQSDATPGDAVVAQGGVSAQIRALCTDLIGAGEFITTIERIAKLAPYTANGTLGEVLGNSHYLFSIDEGYDLKGYVDILREALRKAGMFNGDETEAAYFTVKKGDDRFNDDPFDEVKSALSDDEKHTVAVVSVAAWMDNVRSETFRAFLQAVSAQRNGIVVLVVPFVEKDALQRVWEGVNDVLNVRTVSFAPFGKEELQQEAERYLRSFGASLQPDAWEVFHNLLLREKADGTFYGVSTVKKICRDVLVAKMLYNADNGLDGMDIGSAELASILPHADYTKSAEALLDSMIGLATVRAKLHEVVEQIAAARNIEGMEMPSVHMRFVGNPGTGKTTVARIIGRMLKERGVLRIGDLHEIHGRDLVGRYVGETAPKTAAICRDAYGSVLFIDEAYSLCRSTEDSRDFGREALDTLIAQMENHRNDMVVIMAGYTDDIAKMMTANAGLENRMPYLIEFPNYSRSELGQIFESMVRRFGRFEQAMLEAAFAFFEGLSDEFIQDKSFGNGRYVRNLYERTRAKAIMRSQIEKADEIVLKKEDFAAASADSEFRDAKAKDKRKIGFN